MSNLKGRSHWGPGTGHAAANAADGFGGNGGFGGDGSGNGGGPSSTSRMPASNHQQQHVVRLIPRDVEAGLKEFASGVEMLVDAVLSGRLGDGVSRSADSFVTGLLASFEGRYARFEDALRSRLPRFGRRSGGGGGGGVRKSNNSNNNPLGVRGGGVVAAAAAAAATAAKTKKKTPTTAAARKGKKAA